ncbi:MAG: tRNA (adenosine(37)-N6)-threonylcarbamoyltransferase complex dimerization subunit type 1 TsaB [Chloroflexi bacterium]|nr:tRNA (adenosine(37)-N6)-threonylcarbamoyltransferase complex dimerization subunit type 1 TsaB [Chloroflexota bacterium]
MILVAVDTSTRWAGVGLETGSGERTQIIWRSDQNHGRELMPAIVDLMSRAGLGPPDITHLAVALGPGGFSAVRVGISAVMGLALPRELPVAGIPTHLVEAMPYLEGVSHGSPVISLIPAGRDELSWARFESGSGEPAATGLIGFEEFAADIPAGARVCGEGASLLRDRIAPEQFLSGDAPTRSPASLIELARRRFDSDRPISQAELRPIYARPPSVTAPRPAR